MRTTPPTHLLRSPRGFTVVEVMVALLVAGMAVAGAFGIVAAAADARARLAREREESVPGAAARRALEGWLRAATVLPGGGPLVGEDHRLAALALDELSFAVRDGGALHPGPHRVRLWIERSPVARRTGLLAELVPLRGGGGADTLALAPEAGGMNARYRTTREGTTTWVDSWPPSRLLPEAVELRVLPAPERAADPRGDGLPDLLRLAVAVPLVTDTNAEGLDEVRRPEGLRAGCPAVGAGAGVCAGD